MMTIRTLLVAVAGVAAASVWAKDFDVRAYGAKGDGKADDTVAVQKAIDECSADGGGRVVVDKGAFLIRPISLKDGVDLHIERNAKLLASNNHEDFKSRDNLKHVIGKNMCRGRDSALITADEVHGVSITGNGMIDGNADAFVRLLPEKDWGKWRYERIGGWDQSPPRIVLFAGCTDVTVTDITITNQPSCWAYMIHDCDRVIFDRAKVIANIYHPNNDGLHFNCCRDVSVSNCRVEVGDDALIVRANSHPNRDGKGRPCERVTVTNCRLRGYTDCIRLAWCRDGVIRDCTFSNITMVDACRGICMWMFDKDPGPGYDTGIEKTVIENIVFSNIVMDRIHTYPITIATTEASEWLDRVKNVSFANIIARAYAAPEFVGSKEHPLENFSFSGCRFVRSDAPDVRPPWIKEQEPRLRDKVPSVIRQGFGWGGIPHANGGNPFFNCRNFTFNGCSFEDID